MPRGSPRLKRGSLLLNPRRMRPATRLPRLFFHPPVSGLPLRGLLVRIIGGHLRRRYAIFTQDPQAGVYQPR